MGRLGALILAVMLVITSLALPVGAPTPAAGAALPSVIIQTNRRDINTIYRDFLRRAATLVELREFDHSLGSMVTENDVRAKVIGTREFWRRAGRSTSKFIHAVHREAYGRRARSAEMRQMREVFRRTPGPNAAKRRAVAASVLESSGYDTDGLETTKLIVDRTDSGRIQRITLRLNRPVNAATSSMWVSIDGELVDGRTEVRRAGNVISVVPNSRLLATGQLVATAFSWANGTQRTDATQRVLPIFDGIFPDVRVVAYYGNHQTRLLGVLGETGPEAAAVRVKAAAAPFSEPGRPAVGAFELIATVAQGSAGPDGDYSAPSKIDDLRPWIDVARREGLFVILDIQPGRSDFLTETTRYRELLLEPHVGVALDPEWRMGPTQRPGQTVGSVTAAEVNRVSEWLSDLVIENDLPEKLFIVHQFQSRMVKNREDLVDRPGLATIIHADGFGGRAIKLETYSIIQARPPFWNGFKLFIDEDTRMFLPHEVLAFDTVPVPDLITYQ